MSLQTQGHCALCWEFNRYDLTHCHHCSAVLPWGFLLDPALDVTDEKPPFWWRRRSSASPAQPKPKHRVSCRYCEAPIFFDAKVCFQCRTLLVAGSTQAAGPVFDSDAPALRALIDAYIARKIGVPGEDGED